MITDEEAKVLVSQFETIYKGFENYKVAIEALGKHVKLLTDHMAIMQHRQEALINQVMKAGIDGWK